MAESPTTRFLGRELNSLCPNGRELNCLPMGIFISPEKPGLFLRFVKNKPYFNSSRELVDSFWRKETNDF